MATVIIILVLAIAAGAFLYRKHKKAAAPRAPTVPPVFREAPDKGKDGTLN